MDLDMDANNLLAAIKKYGKIEYEEEDELLLLLLNAAMDTLAAAGIPKNHPSDLYQLAVMRLALHYYENREEIGSGHAVPMGMNWMIEHLRLNDAL